MNFKNYFISTVCMYLQNFYRYGLNILLNFYNRIQRYFVVLNFHWLRRVRSCWASFRSANQKQKIDAKLKLAQGHCTALHWCVISFASKQKLERFELWRKISWNQDAQKTRRRFKIETKPSCQDCSRRGPWVPLNTEFQWCGVFWFQWRDD